VLGGQSGRSPLTIPGSHLIFVADLPGRLADLPRTVQVWVVCSNGHRASIAASLLAGTGLTRAWSGREESANGG
jgi:rhodanese-related sulfurtransferase